VTGDATLALPERKPTAPIRLVGADGLPIAGATLRVKADLPRGSSTYLQQATTDAAGRVRLPALGLPQTKLVLGDRVELAVVDGVAWADVQRSSWEASAAETPAGVRLKVAVEPGLQPGDLLLEACGVDVEGRSLAYVAAVQRGRPCAGTVWRALERVPVELPGAPE